ncbi:GNAT family N-acetyltransferase [Otoolea muris]|uniref:GNAT family N-acetyltransferase n=1 Tax=Otoolea muris TaxID=2941515 RepID=UPI00203CE399|nr:GNAT family N-acetyltransferase [Otoolea muris]
MDGSKGYHWAQQIGNTQSGSYTGYLADDEKNETIPLWRGCFEEDSERFIAYYYKEKTKDNRILAKKDNGFILSMVHYNPYRIRMKDRQWELDYLAGVATDEAHRREGHFRDLFVRMLTDQQKAGKPLAYLVPVNPAVYEPFGFVFIGNVPEFHLNEEAQRHITRSACRDTSEDCGRAAAYMEKWLSARYEMYTQRDCAYVSRLIKELESEGGTLSFLEDKNGLAGLEAVWGLEKQEQRFLYAEDPYTVKTGEKAWNMGRLTNIEAFLGSFHLKEAERISFIVDAVDPLLEENNGTFLWTLDETGADVKKLTSTEELPDAALHAQRFSARAGELVNWLTGYRDAAQIWPERSQELTEAMAAVDVVNGVFLDEIV